MSLEQKQSLENLRRLLRQQNRDISDAKLLALLDWMSTHVKYFPIASTFHLDAWQVVGQKLFDVAGGGDDDASRHLTTWGIIMATLKETHRELRTPTALEADSPGLLTARLIALTDWLSAVGPDILGTPKVKLSPMRMFDFDEDLDPGGPFDPGPLDCKQKAELRP